MPTNPNDQDFEAIARRLLEEGRMPSFQQLARAVAEAARQVKRELARESDDSPDTHTGESAMPEREAGP